ncbi:MAG: hypothetical protein PHQ12_09535 [Chthoniobacteraceae bacterium]|nr:hypothetical protein [Chthoniobacteraceae bacterium]
MRLCRRLYEWGLPWDDGRMQVPADPLAPAAAPENAAFVCPRLERTPEDWPAMDAAFAGIPGVPLRQAWLEGAEPRFRPAVAKMARTAEAMLAMVELEDVDVFNPVSEFNAPAFLRGDVVEIFVLPAGTSRYVELHATPEAALLQLRWTVGWRRRSRPGAPLDLRESLITSPVARALTRRTSGGWSAFLAVPFALMEAAPQAFEEGWRASVCRYDYTRGEEKPVLSSTSAFARVDFHQADCWNRLVFTETAG